MLVSMSQGEDAMRTRSGPWRMISSRGRTAANIGSPSALPLGQGSSSTFRPSRPLRPSLLLQPTFSPTSASHFPMLTPPERPTSYQSYVKGWKISPSHYVNQVWRQFGSTSKFRSEKDEHQISDGSGHPRRGGLCRTSSDRGDAKIRRHAHLHDPSRRAAEL